MTLRGHTSSRGGGADEATQGPARRLLGCFAALAMTAWILFLLLPSGALAQSAADKEADKGVLAGLISRALSTPATRVSVGDVEGALSSDAIISGIELSDRDGVWLRLDRVRIVWRRLALLQRRLEIDRLEVGVLDIRRRPIPAEIPVAGEKEPLLPELPVKVEIKAFNLAELKLGEPILGTVARVAATGQAKLSNDTSEGLDLTLDARRLDAPGTLTARFGLVPQGGRLTLQLRLDEPEGGILARAANIPGQPPVKLDLDGQGTLDALATRLTFDAGPGIGATGSANLGRQGDTRQLALDLAARIEGLLPAAAAPVFAGTTRLTGKLGFADSGAVTLDAIALAAAAARLDIGGTISPDRVADVTVTAANVPNRGDRTATGSTELRRLALRGRLTGPLTGPNLDASFSADEARLPSGRVGRLDATLKVAAAGKDAAGATRLSVVADARATGVVPADPALARAVGDRVAFTLRGTASTEAVLDVDELALTTPTATARYAGRLGSDALRGRLGLEIASLRPFGYIARLPLAGAATFTADLEGTPRANRYNAALDGRIREFATGIAPVDGLLGGSVSLAGIVRVEPTGPYAFENLALTGQHGSATVNGWLGQDGADLKVAAALSDLKRIDPRLTGRANLDGTVTGGLRHPNIVARAVVADATALGRPVALALDVDARDLTGSLDGTVRLDGSVNGKPARGGFHVARAADGTAALDRVDLTVGSTALRGEVALDASSLARGRLTVDAGNLDDLSPLLLTRATGTLSADVALDSSGGGQGARIKADATRVSVYGFTLEKADADLTVADLYRRPVVSGRVRADELAVAGERISRIRLDAQGNPQASNVTLSASARGFDLESRARVLPGDSTRIEVAELSARRGSQRIALTGPATVTIRDGGADLAGIAVALGTGRVLISGRVGQNLDLRAEARSVPLSALDVVSPGLGLAGTFEGNAWIAGTPSAPTGEYRARIDAFSAPALRGLALPRIDAEASGRLADGRSTLAATIRAGAAGSLRIDGSVPLGAAGALDLAIRGGLEAGALTAGTLAAGGRRFSGRLDVDARLRGTAAAPDASGAATLSGGTFSDAGQGIQLSNIRARLVARGSDLAVEGASATTRNGGAITASGRVRLDPAAGLPGEIRIAGQNAELVRSRVVTAVANLQLSLSGPLARDPRVSGRVDLVSAEVSVPERLPATLKPLPKTRHVHPTRTTRARLALDDRAKGRGAAPAFDARLDLVLNAPGRIAVRGRGLNAELGGNLRLTGTLARPVANGAFQLQRGTMQIATTRLDFRSGRLSFTGDLTPELDFVATSNAGGAAIQIAVSGPASDPSFAFTSSPDLPQDEILSRLLFNSPSGQLTAFQALALAQAAAQFSGGDGAFEGLRRTLGVSGLDIGLSNGGIGANLQRSLGNRVSVGVRAGSSAAQTGVGADFRITDEIRLQGEVGVTGGTSVGIGAQYEW